LAPLTIGRWALVAAGSVVTKDVADFSLVAGVPARHIRWVGKAGFPLEREDGVVWRCPQTGESFVESDGFLTEKISK
jgi:UDP-2-acetamido-3-amino-2,3-dideoxy-glucuronate N-acetyltransferase